MVTIAVDMMGSDLGPEELAKGVLMYLEEHGDLKILAVGDQKRLSSLEGNPRIEIVDTGEHVLPMETSVLSFLRDKQNSMYAAISLVKEGKADAVVTAGSTGGFITGATLLLKNVPGVSRAGFCSPFPTTVKGKSTYILDIGASNVNKAEDLVGFARLGKIYAELIGDILNPSVYLLSNGTEEGKGLDESKQAYEILKNNPKVNFKGNVEARNALDGTKDVIVTSGYPGNIFLKSSEGMALNMSAMIKRVFKRNLFTKIAYLFCRKGIKEMKETMDYKKTGGAILLGVNGVAIKTHGNSDARFFYYSMALADKMVKNGVVNKIKEEFAPDGEEKK